MATVIYQVFVDRFARAQAPSPSHRAWHLPPEEPPRGRDLYGGDLDGLAGRLDHIAALGADALYLTPIFAAPSNHKYDTADFEHVDEGFGGDAAFGRLCEAARARGLGVILDAVLNHVGDSHPWAGDRSWLRGTVWRGHGSLPELDLAKAHVREALVGDRGVIANWTRRGATGWRLDCANDLGLEVCRLAAEVARRAGATDGVVGEVMAYPVGWCGAPGLDGVMNYWLRSALLSLGQHAAPAAQVQHLLDRLAGELPLASLLASWNMVSSHDTPRLATELAGDPARIRQVLALQFAYPGKPMVYYGEEVGLTGGADPRNRAGMEWDESRWDQARLALVRRLAHLRREQPALLAGRYVALPQPGTDVVAFARVTERPVETVLCVTNAAEVERRVRLFVALPWMLDGLPLIDLLAGPPSDGPSPFTWSQGCLDLTLGPHAVLLLQPRDAHPSGYRFFK